MRPGRSPSATPTGTDQVASRKYETSGYPRDVRPTNSRQILGGLISHLVRMDVAAACRTSATSPHQPPARSSSMQQPPRDWPCMSSAYPLICQLDTGSLAYDNFGAWGNGARGCSTSYAIEKNAPGSAQRVRHHPSRSPRGRRTHPPPGRRAMKTIEVTSTATCS